MRVHFHELAERELADAFQYYESERPGLGAEFLAEMERMVDAIIAHPDAGQTMGKSHRRRLCRRFPFGLIYRTAGAEIRLVAVMNLRRRPGYWVSRR